MPKSGFGSNTLVELGKPGLEMGRNPSDGGIPQGCLDTTHRRRASALTGRVAELLSAILVVMALPLTFTGKLGILRAKLLSGALHAIEASGISFTLLQKLGTAFVSPVWSKKMALAPVGAVLSLLDGPPGL